MNLSVSKLTKSTTHLGIKALIVLFGVLAGYLYYSMFVPTGVSPVDPPKINRNDNLSKFKDISTFDLKLLSDPRFHGLQVLGQENIPVPPPSPGQKTDVFAP